MTVELLNPPKTVPKRLELALGRDGHRAEVSQPLLTLSGRRVLVTGASGSIGRALVPLLRLNAAEVWETDENTLDVTDFEAVRASNELRSADIVFHLAGAKHAPLGEEDPWYTMQVNAVGTFNVLSCAPEDTRVVLASTCKACNPETAYGASKLLAEKMTTNAGQTVARFHNVVETSGNVFEIWRQIPEEFPIGYTPCGRYFISIREAVYLLLWAAQLPPGRYGVWPGKRQEMCDVARRLYPDRELMEIPRRRGDRGDEPLHAAHEVIVPVPDVSDLMEIVSAHDPL